MLSADYSDFSSVKKMLPSSYRCAYSEMLPSSLPVLVSICQLEFQYPLLLSRDYYELLGLSVFEVKATWMTASFETTV